MRCASAMAPPASTAVPAARIVLLEDVAATSGASHSHDSVRLQAPRLGARPPQGLLWRLGLLRPLGSKGAAAFPPPRAANSALKVAKTACRSSGSGAARCRRCPRHQKRASESSLTGLPSPARPCTSSGGRAVGSRAKTWNLPRMASYSRLGRSSYKANASWNRDFKVYLHLTYST